MSLLLLCNQAHQIHVVLEFGLKQKRPDMDSENMITTGEIYLIADEIMKRLQVLDKSNQGDEEYLNTVIRSLSEECNALREEREYLRSLIFDIEEAITNKGSHPRHHDKIQKQHLSEWPILWRRINRAIKGARRVW